MDDENLDALDEQQEIRTALKLLAEQEEQVQEKLLTELVPRYRQLQDSNELLKRKTEKQRASYHELDQEHDEVLVENEELKARVASLEQQIKQLTESFAMANSSTSKPSKPHYSGTKETNNSGTESTEDWDLENFKSSSDESSSSDDDYDIALQEIEELKATNTELQESNSKIEETNKKLRETNSELEETNSELQEINSELKDHNVQLQGALETKLQGAPSTQQIVINAMTMGYKARIKALETFERDYKKAQQHFLHMAKETGLQLPSNNYQENLDFVLAQASHAKDAWAKAKLLERKLADPNPYFDYKREIKENTDALVELQDRYNELLKVKQRENNPGEFVWQERIQLGIERERNAQLKEQIEAEIKERTNRDKLLVILKEKLGDETFQTCVDEWREWIKKRDASSKQGHKERKPDIVTAPHCGSKLSIPYHSHSQLAVHAKQLTDGSVTWAAWLTDLNDPKSVTLDAQRRACIDSSDHSASSASLGLRFRVAKDDAHLDSMVQQLSQSMQHVQFSGMKRVKRDFSNVEEENQHLRRQNDYLRRQNDYLRQMNRFLKDKLADYEAMVHGTEPDFQDDIKQIDALWGAKPIDLAPISIDTSSKVDRSQDRPWTRPTYQDKPMPIVDTTDDSGSGGHSPESQPESPQRTPSKPSNDSGAEQTPEGHMFKAFGKVGQKEKCDEVLKKSERSLPANNMTHITPIRLRLK